MAQGAGGIVVTGLPVVFHGSARELEVLRNAFIIPCLVDQLNDIADLVVRLRRQHLHIVMCAQIIRKPLDKIGDGNAELLRFL
jgi:hypothetical protein